RSSRRRCWRWWRSTTPARRRRSSRRPPSCCRRFPELPEISRAKTARGVILGCEAASRVRAAMNEQPRHKGTEAFLPDCAVGVGMAAAFARPPSSVLRALSAELPEVPRVQLTDPDSGASPVVLPASEQMPAGEDPAGKYQLLGEIARGGMG